MTPSKFYKQKRPEFFSDSEAITQITLPREVLAYEISKISTNQKQDQFETLCRRLAEKCIAPNLIPQVGPTGGGDGKTDSETYPVSESIADRWFCPENGWGKGENWAFAISAKEDWKNKAKSDIKKIVEIARGYTRVYFMSNQLISSKKKKDAQDEFIKEFSIDLVILDAEWILEKIYSYNLINLVVDSLNLSTVFKNKEIKLGSNDTLRLAELEKLEENINNTNRYFEYDFQLVEDALESAILSRMLERPRSEVEGKFDRSLRCANKINNKKQIMRIYYQKAWTYLNWYDDYGLFIENFKRYKSFISQESNISDIEDYFTLFMSLSTLQAIETCNLADLGIDIKAEKKYIEQILREIVNDTTRPTSSLASRTHICFLKFIFHEKKVTKIIQELLKILEQSQNHLDYPFEPTRKMIEEISKIYPNDKNFDILIDKLALISSKRCSELGSGQIFLKRAIQKIECKNYQESVVYFGKSIVKLAKEETEDYMYFALLGLGMAYKKLDLIWASNHCYITACHLSLKLSDNKGYVSEKTYRVVKEILSNELIIGRIPFILTWHELFITLHQSLNIDDTKEEIPFSELCDGILSTRLMHTDNTADDKFQYLANILEKQELYCAEGTVLYKQGYTDIVMSNYKIATEEELDEFFKKVANQPFVEQMLYATDFMSENKLSLYTNLLGCLFQINFSKDTEMLLVSETLLALLEGFMGTSLSKILSHKEKIIINILKNEDNSNIYFTYDEDSYEYNFYIQNFNEAKHVSEPIWHTMLNFITNILVKNFFIKEGKDLFTQLFEQEEVHERLSFIFTHRNNLLNILGDTPKLFFDDWLHYYNPVQNISKREIPIALSYESTIKKEPTKYTKESLTKVSHTIMKTHTIIDMQLWDRAKWKGFGFMFDPEKQNIGVLLSFENENAAKKIFDKWIERIGKEDKRELIKITIIKGINKAHPFWYKVMVSINEKTLAPSLEQLVLTPSRFHLMAPKDSINLDRLIAGFHHFKKYQLLPAIINNSGTIEPFFEKGIMKASLHIKEAWEIGKDDLESAVIKDDDSPIIPLEHKNDAPILGILKNKHMRKGLKI